ncbi:MAG: UDP-N-acetylmuramoyl-L-alanyl-D-glutamate--2,6-diaminopimelate ligase [Candidatus Omnitrophota bacterium]|jgi:UDP-N-acetylmuramoyl-L-alanyl-D-glutamate--2,6-diaminopimelate ligase
MRLAELLKDIYDDVLPAACEDIDVQEVCSDSRQVSPGSLFVALRGPREEGTHYIPDAVQKGARVIVTDSTAWPDGVIPPCVLRVPDTRRCLQKLVWRFYGDACQSLRVIGVTGTNGKTTITYLVESILKKAGRSCGVVGTINSRMGNTVWPSKNTTPGLVENFRFLADLASQGAEACVMEVSSHGLHQGRVEGIPFSQAVLTNVTQDHLDYHQNMEDYFLAKARLFVTLSSQSTAVINGDDPYGRRLCSLTKGRLLTYGIESPADFMADNIQLTLSGTEFFVVSPSGRFSVKSALIGQHNVYNILAACAVGMGENVPWEHIQAGIESCVSVPGRMEAVRCGQPFHVFIDYAHTEDALQNVLRSIKAISNARIILVFGCGGDRDTGKRPKMGRVASELADQVIVTNDNPRSEPPQHIIDQILSGFSHDRFRVIPDRAAAIEAAIQEAGAGDVVLLAGKGHENYQIFKEQTIPFDEKEIARQCLYKGKSR